MEEKKNIKISLSTFFLIISTIIIVVMGVTVYKFYSDKQSAELKLMNLNIQVTELEKEIKELKTTSDKITSKTIDTNNYTFKLDSKNKYIITTDYRWKTMLNDGGSHSSIYYQIDLDNKIISKIQEDYKANLAGTSSKSESTLYVKHIDDNMKNEINSLINEITTREETNENKNYNFFTIQGLNFELDIYNINTIEKINLLLNKIDELK